MIVNYILLNFIYLFFYLGEMWPGQVFVGTILLYKTLLRMKQKLFWHQLNGAALVCCLIVFHHSLFYFGLPSWMSMLLKAGSMRHLQSCIKNFYIAKYLRIALFALAFAVRRFHTGHWEFRVHSTDTCNTQQDTGGNPCVCLIVTANQIGLLSQSSKWDVLLKYVGFPLPQEPAGPMWLMWAVFLVTTCFLASNSAERQCSPKAVVFTVIDHTCAMCGRP